MFSKKETLLLLGVISLLVPTLLNAQQMKCAYGERGSLTATCVNATASFFRATSYRFDSLDETLRCVNCQLDAIEANSFDISGNQIITLDLPDSKITILKDSAFVGLVFMKNLFLQNNQIRVVIPGIFRGVKKLENLQMSNNSISILNARGFKELVNLTVLNLEFNAIASIDIFAFEGLASLKTLMLSHNHIKDIKFIFSTLPQVQTIDLAYNEISDVKSYYLENATAVLSLNLAHNQIKSLPQNAFSILTKMEKVDLSWNVIQEIDAKAFANLRSLEYLYLDSNQIKDLEKFVFFGLTDLRELNLANNSIKYFQTGLCTGLPELRYLNVSHNRIVQFERTGILALQNLHTLDLSHNNLTDLDYKILHHITPKITYLVLNDNNWPCYLVSEIDLHFKDDNVKLSADGLLLNNTCKPVRKVENEAVQQELIMEEHHTTPSVHSYIIYPALFILFASNFMLFYLLYRMDQLSKFLGSSNSRSHANLLNSELQAHDNVEY